MIFNTFYSLSFQVRKTFQFRVISTPASLCSLWRNALVLWCVPSVCACPRKNDWFFWLWEGCKEARCIRLKRILKLAENRKILLPALFSEKSLWYKSVKRVRKKFVKSVPKESWLNLKSLPKTKFWTLLDNFEMQIEILGPSNFGHNGNLPKS